MGNANAAGRRRNSSELTESELELIKNNSRLTEEQIKALHSNFVNQYPDGFITRREYIKLYSEIYEQGNPEKFATFAFKAFDKDGSGTISFSEFALSTAFLINYCDPKEKQLRRLELAFDVFDCDKNGKVDKAEMKTVYDALCELNNQPHGRSKELVDDTFKKYDINRSGYLEKYEFVNAVFNVSNLLAYFS